MTNSLLKNIIETINRDLKNLSKNNLNNTTIMKKVSKETKREQCYNANLHNIFVKAQKEIANE